MLLAVVSYAVWWGIDHVLGRSLPAQVLSVGLALVLGAAAYGFALLRLGLPEARQVLDLLMRRFRRGAAS